MSKKLTPLKLLAIFSLTVNLQIFFQFVAQLYSACLPVLIHLSENLYELYHFLSVRPHLSFNNSIQFIAKFTNYVVKEQIASYDIKLNITVRIS